MEVTTPALTKLNSLNKLDRLSTAKYFYENKIEIGPASVEKIFSDFVADCHSNKGNTSILKTTDVSDKVWLQLG